MTLTCPGCGKTFDAPPSAAGHTVRCACGATFAARPAAVPALTPPEGSLAWGWANFRALGPWGRPAYALGLCGGALALVCAILWLAAVVRMEHAYRSGLGWGAYRSPSAADPGGHFGAMRLAHAGVWFGAAVALVGLVAALLNANREPTPRHARPPVVAGVAGLVMAATAALVVWSRSE